LDEQAELILGDIRTDIGGVILNRRGAIEGPALEPRDAALLLLTGPPGVGKSGLWKALVEEYRLHGPGFVLSAERIEGTGWSGFAAAHRIGSGLSDLLLAISAHPFPCIFIDGLDKIEDDGARALVNDILRMATRTLTTSDGTQRWWCIATARENDPDRLRWLDRRVIGHVQPLRVPELNDVDLELVAQVHGHLRAVIAEPRLEAVLRNSFLLDLLTDVRMFGGRDAPPPGTEVEVSDVWWDRLVGRNGRADGRARQQVLVAAARSLLAGSSRRFPDGGLPAEALASLESDRIILRDRGTNVCRFAHDLHEDWAMVRVLGQEAGGLPRFLADRGERAGLYRATQLFGCSLLEREPDGGSWARLLRAVEAGGLSPRWRQAVLTGLFLSTRAEELLDRAAPILFEGSSGRLVDLLAALRTGEIDLDPQVEALARSMAWTPEAALALAIRSPIPRWRTWHAVLQWLIRNADALNGPAREEAARLLEIWQEKTSEGWPLRREIAELAMRWLRESREE
jgi:hypothetical protein